MHAGYQKALHVWAVALLFLPLSLLFVFSSPALLLMLSRFKSACHS